MGVIAQSLAQLSAAAYGGALPIGFMPVSFSDAPNGLFINQNAAAVVATGSLSGQQVVVLSFRGSDDRQDWLNDLRDINADYSKFANLAAEVDAYALQRGLKVVVTGHSLGAALAQDFMAQHPDGAVQHIGVTFGSPGAEIAPAADTRITNYEIVDDPIAFLGLHRAAVGKLVSSNPLAADAFAVELAAAGTGLTFSDAIGSIPFLTADYVNRGQTITLTPPGSHQPLSITSLLTADPSEHDLSLYFALAAGAPDPSLGTVVTTPGVDAQASAILLPSFITGLAPSAADYARTLTTATNLINQAGGNVAAAWQQLGAAFADDSGYNAAFLQKYGALTDAQFITTVYANIFTSAPSAQAVSFLTTELAYYEGIYKPYQDAGDPNGVTRARGTLIGDLFQQIEDPRNGHFTDNKYYAAEQQFAAEIAAGTAHFGTSGGLFA